MKKSHVPQEMHQEQVKNLLKFIDASQDEAVKKDLFYQLGYECFHARNLDAWIGKWTGNVQAFLNWVNVEHASKYWERLEFTEDGTALVLTGKKVEGVPAPSPIVPNRLYPCVIIAARTFNRNYSVCCWDERLRSRSQRHTCWAMSGVIPSSISFE